ncbi:bifunctional UDP-sugar hydrolase/5'-nucleotidase [Enterobacteriaceae bacterium RIT693]|nr:bifunctional UDP-sugar hydrolase/5'-nucleotidase [Enterobacteriaceae bacterium RIT693]
MDRTPPPLLLATLLSSALFSSPLLAWEKDRTYPITLLHTNDHHGHFWQNELGEYGLAAQKTLVDEIRKQVKNQGGVLLLLSGGDVNTGVPESDLMFAEPDFKGMSKIGYDAMAIGNHEFDHSLKTLRKQQKWASFPFISANIYNKKSGKRLFKPYALFTRQKIKIAVIGLTTQDTVKSGRPRHFDNITFTSPTDEVRHLVEHLKKNQKPDIIIAATHMGHYAPSSGEHAEDDVDLAKALPPGTLDIIVGGHTQQALCMNDYGKEITDYVPGMPCKPDRQNGTWIVQANEWGRYVGRADFTFRNGELKLVNYQLIPVNLKKAVRPQNGEARYAFFTSEIRQDPGMIKLLGPWQEKSERILMQKIGELKGELVGDRQRVRSEQTNLSRLVLTSQMALTGADFAVINGGGVRTTLHEGDITRRDTLLVLPFRNQVAYIDLTGKEAADYISAVAIKPSGTGYYAQFANVTFTLKGNKASDIAIKGKAIQYDKVYRLATLDAIASGGIGYPRLDDKPGYVNTGKGDADTLADFIQTHSPVNSEQWQPGRIL